MDVAVDDVQIGESRQIHVQPYGVVNEKVMLGTVRFQSLARICQ